VEEKESQVEAKKIRARRRVQAIQRQASPEEPYEKYSREYNEQAGRSKRAIRKDDNKNTCSLFIQTDPLIWRHIYEQVSIQLKNRSCWRGIFTV